MIDAGDNTAIQILGIDAAVDPRNNGLAVAEYASCRCKIQSVQTACRGDSVARQLLALIDVSRPLLVAIDAPLGWPTALGRALHGHAAGRELDGEPSELFTRTTDHYVREHTGLKPLDVGADRIARTAAAALKLVAALRTHAQQPLPLLQSPTHAANGGLIEVYPAATLKQRSLPFRQYKKPDATEIREMITASLAEELDMEGVISQCIESDHCLDAVLCVLAATDFLAGRCAGPADIAHFKEEGWIWFASA
jgi:predicted RNase H-like nuclease